MRMTGGLAEMYSMILFNRLHRLYGELVAMAAPIQILEGLQRIYRRRLNFRLVA